MAGFRSFFPQGALSAGQTAKLDVAESRHLTKALRARPGDAVTLFDGRGTAWDCVLTETGRDAVVRVETELAPAKPAAQLTLAVGLLKGKALDAVIKCAVELGAAGIVPLFTRHSEVRLDADRAESKAAHWRTTAIEAAKQSGNLAAFSVATPVTLEDWLKGDLSNATKLVASLEPGAVPILAAVREPSRPILVLIGPEGDFSAEEYARIRATGFTPVDLGPHVLRAETACTYVASALQAHLHAI
ncbi:16S rRNA (uracil(1498)-N(3))-methyltransferase [Cerasicoccus fimbriatus]|uniref:16S rRNA (uracil(1498)-N(3))-methyltransferase n=1 Tax=Cerasicoccus fimbriatus TaxID=3014554 RepID=UPI0022B34F43|nr:16S rRNA (uracil(1498)-N(3))-methyltransferase [Cerasicoccus sp. TK19100]